MRSLLQVADTDQQYLLLLLDGPTYIRSVSPMVRLPDAVIMDDQTLFYWVSHFKSSTPTRYYVRHESKITLSSAESFKVFVQ